MSGLRTSSPIPRVIKRMLHDAPNRIIQPNSRAVNFPLPELKIAVLIPFWAIYDSFVAGHAQRAVLSDTVLQAVR